MCTLIWQPFLCLVRKDTVSNNLLLMFDNRPINLYFVAFNIIEILLVPPTKKNAFHIYLTYDTINDFDYYY